MNEPARPAENDAQWTLDFDGYDPHDQGRRETLCIIGNGLYNVRGADPTATADESHYPGTYRAGCYNRLTSIVNNARVEDESVVNLPNWLPLTFRIAGGAWYRVDAVRMLQYRQTLDLRRGMLLRTMRFSDDAGRITALRETRLVSMSQPHLAALRLELTPENWEGELELCSGIDGRVTNDLVPRYRPYTKHHLQVTGSSALDPSGIQLSAYTTTSRIAVSVAVRTRVDHAEQRPRGIFQEPGQIAEHISVAITRGKALTVEKVAALVTARDPAVDECGAAARRALSHAPDFATLRDAHQQAWSRLWAACDVHISPADLQLPIRLHMFHLLQMVAPHSEGLDIGLPARGWAGEEYRGQIFWDELFVFPVLAARLPALARRLLVYRYQRLDRARAAAREHGRRGAMFPWRSASTGREETPTFQYNLESETWYRDYTFLQRHIGAAIAYNVWQYTRITGDAAFLSDYGAEMVLEIARFWASAVCYNAEQDRFEIYGVVGPDEYHTAYPGADEPGLRNNSYTNLMAAWVLACAPEVLRRLPERRRSALMAAIELSDAELACWDTISHRMRLVRDEHGALMQFEGFDALEPFDLERFESEHKGARIDWTLMAQGDDVNRYQVAKQADAALLAYLLTPAELEDLIERQGERFGRDALQRTLDAALAHTAHESSLSQVIFAGALAPLDPARSWELFTEALTSDLEPESTSTKTGPHVGATVGALGVLQQHYLGVRFGGSAIVIDPALPSAIDELHMGVLYHGAQVDIAATQTTLTVHADSTNRDPVTIVVRGESMPVVPGATVHVSLEHGAPRTNAS